MKPWLLPIPKDVDKALPWKPDVKAYQMKMYSVKQAQGTLDALRSIDELNAADLPEKIDAGLFAKKDAPKIDFIPCTDTRATPDGPSRVAQVMAASGDTFALKEHFKQNDYAFRPDFQGEEDVNLWVAPLEHANVAVLKKQFEDLGWVVTIYDSMAP